MPWFGNKIHQARKRMLCVHFYSGACCTVHAVFTLVKLVAVHSMVPCLNQVIKLRRSLLRNAPADQSNIPTYINQAWIVTHRHLVSVQWNDWLIMDRLYYSFESSKMFLSLPKARYACICETQSELWITLIQCDMHSGAEHWTSVFNEQCLLNPCLMHTVY